MEKYRDAQLDTLIDEALPASPSLATVRAAGASLSPSMEASAGVSKVK